MPTPVSPDFAGFGLFNGPITYEDGRIFAGLYEFSPAGIPEPDHVMAFDASDGALLWSQDFGRTWSGASVQNGVVYVGNSEAGELHTFDATNGDPLGVYSLPTGTTSLAQLRGDTLYVGCGVFGATGGVRAYRAPAATVPALGPVGMALSLCLLGATAYWRLLGRRARGKAERGQR